ncbi:hypothetical protein A2U01_0064261, partial [Trifolium medium]|nr:hypothetical protein [Trifolium medium]
MPPRRRAPAVTQREEIAQLRLQVEQLTQQLADLQPSLSSDSETATLEDDNPFANHRGADRRWEVGFKV